MIFVSKEEITEVGLMYSGPGPSVCSLAQRHATISSFSVAVATRDLVSAAAWSEWGWDAPLFSLGWGMQQGTPGEFHSCAAVRIWAASGGCLNTLLQWLPLISQFSF